jgi:hypothetical protein
MHQYDSAYVKRQQTCIRYAKWLLIILLSLAFSSFYFLCAGSDKTFHLERVYALAQEIRIQGLLSYPYYISSHTNFGFGYATPIFYPDFFLLIPAILVLAGAPLPLVMALWNGLVYGLSFWTMQTALRRMGYSSTYVPSVCYICSSFLVFESIDRGSQGSNMIFLFAPIVFSSVILICHGKELRKNAILLAVSMSGCILSHVLSSLILVIGLLIYLLLDIKYLFQETFGKKLLCYLTAAVGSLGLTAWFLFPMLEQLLTQKLYVNSSLVETGKFSLTNTVLLPVHLFFRNDIASIIYERFQLTPKYIEQITWTLPSNFWGNIGILCMVSAACLGKWRKERHLGIVFCVEGALCVLISFTQIFTGISFLNVFQFVWRIMLLLPVSVSLALAVCLNAGGVRDDRVRNISLLLSLLCIGGYYLQLLIPLGLTTQTIPSLQYEDGLLNSNVMQGEYLPEAFPDVFYGYDSEQEFPGVISGGYDKDGYHFVVDETFFRETSQVLLPVTWYLGYTAYDSNGEELDICEGSTGTVQLNELRTPEITVKYTGTRIQKISRSLSIVVALAFIAVCCGVWKDRHTAGAKSRMGSES